MRIGVDACCWASDRGYGRYTRELVRAMVRLAPDDEWLCFVDDAAASVWDITASNVLVRRVTLRADVTRAAASDGARSLRDMLRLTRAVWRERLAVFFSPAVYSFFPVPPGLRTVVTVHDTIAERYPELTLPTWRARLFWRAKVGVALAQARLVLTVSHQSARDIAADLGVAPERIRVAPNAPAAVFRPSDSAEEIARVAARVGMPAGARWFIYVGGCNPHKRLEVAVRAHAALVAERGSAAPWLALVGPDNDVFHSNREGLCTLVDSLGSGHRVVWAGFLEDQVLRHLYSGAVGLVLPSQLEGTGLPALEAAACGTPVVATVASPLPELLAGGGFFVAPGDEEALRRALARLLDDEGARREMGAAALAGARRLDWADSGARALAALREAAA